MQIPVRIAIEAGKYSVEPGVKLHFENWPKWCMKAPDINAFRGIYDDCLCTEVWHFNGGNPNNNIIF